MQFSKFIFLILILNLLKADGFDTLTYYEKFDVAVQTYKEERYRLSEKYFSSILINDKDYRDPASQLMLAKSQYQQNKWQDAVRSAKSVLSNFPGSPYQGHTLLLMGDIALSQGKNSEAFQNYLSIRPTAKDSLQLSDIDQRLIICIGNGLKEERIEGILFREKNPTNRAIINFARAYLSWINGDAYDFSLAINGIDMQVFPQSFFHIYSPLKNTKPISFSRSVTLGVIVPLTGPEKELGQSYLLGLADYLDNLSSVHSIRFLVFDSKGDGVNSLQIVKSLHSNRNIIGIIGPLLEEEVLTLAGFKSSLPILIPNSGPPGLSDIAPNLFFLSPSSKAIAHRIAQLMITELGFENIAVLSPGDGKLKAMTDHFLEECHQLGVVPVATEWYIEKPENLLRQFKSIRKIAWTLLPEKDPNEDAMNLTIDSLDALFDVDVTDFYEIPEEEEKMDRKDSANVVLETIHAMYIPIRQDELTYVGTQFPMYNLKTMLFGNENWLDMTILNQELIGPHVQGMRIISNVNSANTISGDNSISNYHILAMDHGSFVQSIISSGVMNRRQFMDRLRKHSGFHGKQTSIQFTGANKNENGSAQVLEYKQNKMKNIGVYDGTIYSQTSE